VDDQVGPWARCRCCHRPSPTVPLPHPACDSHRTGRSMCLALTSATYRGCRFRGPRGRDRGVTKPVSRVYLPVSLTAPAPSGSPGTTRLCRGCSRPPRRPAAQAASSFTPPLRRRSDGRSSTSIRTNSASWRTSLSVTAIAWLDHCHRTSPECQHVHPACRRLARDSGPVLVAGRAAPHVHTERASTTGQAMTAQASEDRQCGTRPDLGTYWAQPPALPGYQPSQAVQDMTGLSRECAGQRSFQPAAARS
jgi:hypothetical protein